MDIEQLSDYLAAPEVHRKVLSGYRGAYSLGIGQATDGTPVLVLQIEGSAGVAFPPAVRVGGESIPVIVHENFPVPQPL